MKNYAQVHVPKAQLSIFLLTAVNSMECYRSMTGETEIPETQFLAYNPQDVRSLLSNCSYGSKADGARPARCLATLTLGAVLLLGGMRLATADPDVPAGTNAPADIQVNDLTGIPVNVTRLLDALRGQDKPYGLLHVVLSATVDSKSSIDGLAQYVEFCRRLRDASPDNLKSVMPSSDVAIDLRKMVANINAARFDPFKFDGRIDVKFLLTSEDWPKLMEMELLALTNLELFRDRLYSLDDAKETLETLGAFQEAAFAMTRTAEKWLKSPAAIGIPLLFDPQQEGVILMTEIEPALMELKNAIAFRLKVLINLHQTEFLRYTNYREYLDQILNYNVKRRDMKDPKTGSITPVKGSYDPVPAVQPPDVSKILKVLRDAKTVDEPEKN